MKKNQDKLHTNNLDGFFRDYKYTQNRISRTQKLKMIKQQFKPLKIQFKNKKSVKKTLTKQPKTIDISTFLVYNNIMENKKKEVSKMSHEELLNEYKNLQIKYDNTILELNALKRFVFGSKQEKIPTKESIDIDQYSLFDNEEDMEKDVEEQSKEQLEEITVYRKKKSKKRVAGLKKSTIKDVVVKRQEYVLNEDEKCPECNSNFKLVGKKVVRTQIDFTPATFNVTEIVQNIYKCTKCGTEESEKETPTFAKAKTPNPLLQHSFASPSLASEVFYQKYYLGVPFYRQEKMWDDKGLVLPRNNPSE